MWVQRKPFTSLGVTSLAANVTRYPVSAGISAGQQSPANQTPYRQLDAEPYRPPVHGTHSVLDDGIPDVVAVVDTAGG